MSQTYHYYNPETGEPVRSQRRPKKSNHWLRTIALALVFGLVAGLTFTGVSYGGRKLLADKDKGTGSTSVYTSESKDKTGKLLQTTSASSTNISDIAESVMPSVVSITSMSVKEVESFFGSQMQEAKSAGSGIILGENDDELLIATNNHVIEGSEKLTVTFKDEESVSGAIKGADAKLDLAVVAVKKADIPKDTMKVIKIATMGDSGSARVGDTAIAIGNALGYGQSVTTGVISATNRSIEGVSGSFIQTDAAINPGNSGGALVNSAGEIIGINSAKIQDTSVEGMGYAIPISDAKEILQKLMNKQTREEVAESEQGFLGIVGRTVDETTAQMYDIPTGVYVTEVEKNSAAEKAGVEEGMIITAFDDNSLDGMDGLQSLLKTYKAGEKVKIQVSVPKNDDEYQDKELTVTLGKRKGVN